MQVNPINNAPVTAPSSTRSAASVPATATTESASFKGVEALNQALNTETSVRSEEVQRGRELMASVHYPPTEMMHRLSRLLADNWTNPLSE